MRIFLLFLDAMFHNFSNHFFEIKYINNRARHLRLFFRDGSNLVEMILSEVNVNFAIFFLRNLTFFFLFSQYPNIENADKMIVF